MPHNGPGWPNDENGKTPSMKDTVKTKEGDPAESGGKSVTLSQLEAKALFEAAGLGEGQLSDNMDGSYGDDIAVDPEEGSKILDALKTGRDKLSKAFGLKDE